jgi:hypothetical protein
MLKIRLWTMTEWFNYARFVMFHDGDTNVLGHMNQLGKQQWTGGAWGKKQQTLYRNSVSLTGRRNWHGPFMIRMIVVKFNLTKLHRGQFNVRRRDEPMTIFGPRNATNAVAKAK